MSQSSTPLLHQVIPLFDGLTRALDDHASDPTNCPAVRPHGNLSIHGQMMLNKYYGLLDDSVMYRIAMCMSLLIGRLPKIDISFNLVLHPRYKSSYFLKAGWPREWVQTAEDLLRAEWERNYKPKSSATPIAAVSSSFWLSNIILLTYLQPVQTKNKYFEDFDSFNASSSSADPITDWLTSPPIPGADGLMWWSVMEVSGHPLSRMGSDFLSAPGMLVI